jgi:competence protein ComEA
MLRFFTLLLFLVNLALATVNINTADAKELSALKGIGATKAQAIVDWRTANGSFKSIDELAQVKGVGKKTLESIKDEITIDEDPSRK